ncbi:cupin domain-containing protein [Thiocystis violascens]|uniref:Cupin domain-containing protein n=1 Tax=Thiocystis violascens (strain ATCC 17096 / DSM 198 / 6111) TaxID=765911 RepID=I3YBJ4_THIV6|nr:cupin domain-containing protein [Thiocystis violascens]AFL74362.1 cupin domain-containing protein [Thiocystis violascens DSM 198]
MNMTRGEVYTAREADEFHTAEGCFILETWNREADPAVSIARARVAPKVTTRLHRLAGIVERYLILSGEGLVEVEGMESRRVRAGDLVHIPAGLGQRIGNRGKTDLVFLAICTPRFTPHAYQDIDPEPFPDSPT